MYDKIHYNIKNKKKMGKKKKIGMKNNIEHVYVKLKHLEGSGWPARVTIIKEDFLEE